MADKTNSTRTTPYPFRSAYGTFQLRWIQESTCVSTAVIRYGDVVQFDGNVATANFRVRKSSTMTNVPNVMSTNVFLGIAVGIPSDPASTVTATAPGSTEQSRMVQVCLATGDTEFWFPTKSSAVTSSLVGLQRAVGYDSTLGMFYCDVGNSTAGDAILVITDIPEPGTDANNPVIAKFLSTAVSRLLRA